MAARETNLNKSDFYHTALDTLMDTLHISSTPNLESTHNNSFHRHFHKVDEEKFFSFCSTIKRAPKSDPPLIKDKQTNTKNTNNIETTSTHSTDNRDTPKRLVTSKRKQKLFEKYEAAEEEKDDFKLKTRSNKLNKELSPQTLLLKKAILRLECLERQQQRKAMSKKPMRTSLRI